ncbi:MAG: propanoyl-CoA acyltransferase [Deltaproteobacteria bacterium]|nr:propanoyl-CoA acyltransferase [Deltaproteobacteria bacterium]
MSKVSIVGAHNTAFGAFVSRNRETGQVTDTRSLYDLVVEAGRGAIADAGLEARDIDAVYVGSCAPGLFCNQEHVAPLAAEIDPSFRFKPMTRTEAACASSSVAVYDATYAIEAGRYQRVLVIGVEKMNLLDTKGVTHALATCSHWPTEGATGATFPGLFAAFARGYQKRYGLSDEELRRMFATVAALGYRNGVKNPLAHFGAGSVPDKMKLFSAEAILALPAEGKGSNPVVADPLRLHDCSLISDGAAAVVLAPSEQARARGHKAAEIAGIGHSVERMPETGRANLHELMAGKDAVRKAFAEAKISLKDVSFAEVHDCFTINQILCTEALGLSDDGRGGHDYLAGRFTPEDKCPVNLSGGLKAKGHPVGATGASMHALAYKQLVGEPIGVAAKNPEVAVTFNVGGSGVTNCVTVLRRLR